MPRANNIANLRKIIGKTQRKLAVDVGVSEMTIRNIEAGKYRPHVYLVIRIMKALGVSDIEKIFSEWEDV